MSKRKQPDLVVASVEHHMKAYGFDKNQATSIAWSEYFEEKAAQIEAKYQGNVWASFKFDCYCKTCGKGNVFHAADTVRLFIWDHKGHNTKTRKVG